MNIEQFNVVYDKIYDRAYANGKQDLQLFYISQIRNRINELKNIAEDKSNIEDSVHFQIIGAINELDDVLQLLSKRK